MKVNKYINRFCNLVKHPSGFLVELDSLGLIRLKDKDYINLLYRYHMGYFPNLDRPVSFNEKIQWLKLHDHNKNYIKMVDKYKVKEYIETTIGKSIIIPTIGVWSNPDDIDFDALPNKFVLKCTHDSGGVIICRDKNTFDFQKAKKRLNSRMKKNYYYSGREWPYKYVVPQIMIEKYIEDNDSKQLTDYKIHCFNGKAKIILVCKNRFCGEGMTEDFFSIHWEHLNVRRKTSENSNLIVPPPKNLNRMLAIAEQLAFNIPFLRVDFYEVNGEIYFGELTFYPASGFEPFYPTSFDYKMGGWLSLDYVKNDKNVDAL